MTFRGLLLLPASVLITAFSLISFAFGATLLPDDEVQALKDIAKTLGKTDWDFGGDPCSRTGGWWDDAIQGSEKTVTCNCSFSSGTVCHVISIDLTRNYLYGGIPPEWGSLGLINISFTVNRLTGPIPIELASISTLVKFTADHNQFSGQLPPKLASLPNIQKLHINSNNFSGEIPDTFAQLSSLKELRISDNHFTGKIPNFIQHWTNIENLELQASGLVGPIPDGIAALEKLTDLSKWVQFGSVTGFSEVAISSGSYLIIWEI